MTLTSLLVVLTLFAYVCGFATGVLATHAWHRNRADEGSVSWPREIESIEDAE